MLSSSPQHGDWAAPGLMYSSSATCKPMGLVLCVHVIICMMHTHMLIYACV
jgi:hypothetical protein